MIGEDTIFYIDEITGEKKIYEGDWKNYKQRRENNMIQVILQLLKKATFYEYIKIKIDMI
jgi:hypothetical protein